MSKKKRGGGGANNNNGNTGGGGPIHLSKEKLAALDTLAKKEEDRKKKSERKDLVKHVTKQIRKKGVAGSSDSHSEAPRSSYLQGLLGYSSDSSSSSASSGDEDKKKKKKRKKRKAALTAVESKFAEMEAKIKELESTNKSSEALKVAVETHLTPTKPTGKPTTLDKPGWDELVRRSQPQKQAAPGLLSPFFEEEAEEAVSVHDFLVTLDQKMDEANEVEPFNGTPGKVGKVAEAGVKRLASQIADLHFPGKDTTSTEFDVLKNMKEKYIKANASKNPDTILAALLRSLTSRKVDLSPAECGL